MKTPNIQNVFKMMIGTSALIASTAFFINTISPVQASENKVPNSEINNETKPDIWVGCGSGIYRGSWSGFYETYEWKKVSL